MPKGCPQLANLPGGPSHFVPLTKRSELLILPVSCAAGRFWFVAANQSQAINLTVSCQIGDFFTPANISDARAFIQTIDSATVSTDNWVLVTTHMTPQGL